MPFFCYIVKNEKNNTYNGYTNNLKRRIRQHNGEIKGGARATCNRGPWSFLAILTSPCWDCISTAMKHEWSIKYPTRKRPRPKEYNGSDGRLKSLVHVFEHMKSLNCKDVIVYMDEGFLTKMSDICEAFDFVTLKNMNELILDESIKEEDEQTKVENIFKAFNEQ